MSRSGRREQHGPLRADRDGSAQIDERQVPQVDAADLDVAVLRVVEARDEAQEARLAGSGAAADRHDLARGELEVDAAQHIVLGRVGEVDPLEPHRERSSGQRRGMFRLGQRADPVEPREAAAGRRDRPLAEVDDPAQRLERPRELQEQGVEQRELAERELTVDHEVAADREHRGDRERRHEQQQRQVACLDARLLQHPVPHGARTHAEAVAHVLLATERLHHLDADDGLVRRPR